MKRLFSKAIHQQKPSKCRRGELFVWAETVDVDIEDQFKERIKSPEGKEVEDDVLGVLLCPSNLGWKELRALIKAEEGHYKDWNLDSEKRSAWTKAVRYFAQLVPIDGKSSSAMQMLYKIAGESQLMDLLSAQDQELVQYLVDERIIRIEAALKGAETLEDLPADIQWEMIGLFKSLQKSSQDKKELKEAKQKIVELITDKMTSFQLRCFSQFREDVKKNSLDSFLSRGNEDMKRMMLLQVNTLLKDEELKNHTFVTDMAKDLGHPVQNVLDVFLETVTEKSVKQHIDTSAGDINPYWNMVEDLMHEVATDADPSSLSTEQKDQFEHYAGRIKATNKVSRAITALTRLDESTQDGLFTPEQYRVLWDLQTDPLLVDELKSAVVKFKEKLPELESLREKQQEKNFGLFKDRAEKVIARGMYLLRSEKGVSNADKDRLEQEINEKLRGEGNANGNEDEISIKDENRAFLKHFWIKNNEYAGKESLDMIDDIWEKYLHSFEDDVSALEVDRSSDIKNYRDGVLKLHEYEGQIRHFESLSNSDRILNAQRIFDEQRDAFAQRMESKKMTQTDFELLLDKGVVEHMDLDRSYVQTVQDTRNEIWNVLSQELEPKIKQDAGDVDKLSSLLGQHLSIGSLRKLIREQGVYMTKINKNPDHDVVIQNEFLKAFVLSVKTNVFTLLEDHGNVRDRSGLLNMWTNIRFQGDRLERVGVKALDKDIYKWTDHKHKNDQMLNVVRNQMVAEHGELNWDNSELGKNLSQYHTLFMTGEDAGGNVIQTGVEHLTKLRLVQKDIADPILETVQPFKNKLDNLGDDIANGNVNKVQSTYKELYQDWQKDASGLLHQIEGIESFLMDIFEVSDVDGLPEDIRDLFSKAKNSVREITSLFQELGDGGFNAEKDVKVRELVDNMLYFFDFSSGAIAKKVHDNGNNAYSKEKVQLYDRYMSGVGLLRENKVLKEDGSVDTDSKEAFQEAFEELREKTANMYEEYFENIEMAGKHLRDDLKTCAGNEEKFKQKYGMGFDRARQQLKEYEESSGKLKGKWELFMDPDFAETWLEKYDKASAVKKVEQIAELDDWYHFVHDDYLKNLGTVSEQFIKFNNAWDNKTGGFLNYKEYEGCNNWFDVIKKHGQSWGGTFEIRSFSLGDVMETWKKFWEGRETLHKRNQDRAVAELGQRFTWGQSKKEFRRMGEDSESERVKQFEANYAQSPHYEVRKFLYNTNDRDEAKACINWLNEKGLLQWRDPMLWEALTRLGATESFDREKTLELDAGQLQEKIKKAVTQIWREQQFQDWNNAMEGNLKKQVGNYEADFRRFETDKDGLNGVMVDILQKWRDGTDDAEANSAKFLSFLHMAFQQGKMNGAPDPRLYYIIMGCSMQNPKGQTLINQEDINWLYNENVAVYPYLEFFLDVLSPKKPGEITDGGEKRSWRRSDYDLWAKQLDPNKLCDVKSNKILSDQLDRFFNEKIFLSQNALMRASRMGNKEYDHDDAEIIITGLSYNEVDTYLVTKSENNNKLTDDFWIQAVSGANGFLKSQKQLIVEGNKKYGDNEHWQKNKEKYLKECARVMKSVIYMNQILFGNMTAQSDTYGRSQQFRGDTIVDGNKNLDLKPPLKEANKFNKNFTNILGAGLTDKMHKLFDFEDEGYGVKKDMDSDKKTKWAKENRNEIQKLIQGPQSGVFEDFSQIEAFVTQADWG